MKKLIFTSVVALVLAFCASATAFNKEEILSDIQGKDWVGKIVSVEYLAGHDTPDGAKYYDVNIREYSEDGTVSRDRSIRILVEAEGAAKEKATYRDRFPASTITPKTDANATKITP